MQTIRRKRARTVAVKPKTTESESVLEQLIDVSVQPDRAHHDELGRTRNGTEQPASPREQPAAPVDISRVGE